jgi:hypothetical protein
VFGMYGLSCALVSMPQPPSYNAATTTVPALLSYLPLALRKHSHATYMLSSTMKPNAGILFEAARSLPLRSCIISCSESVTSHLAGLGSVLKQSMSDLCSVKWQRGFFLQGVRFLPICNLPTTVGTIYMTRD